METPKEGGNPTGGFHQHKLTGPYSTSVGKPTTQLLNSLKGYFLARVAKEAQLIERELEAKHLNKCMGYLSCGKILCVLIQNTSVLPTFHNEICGKSESIGF